MYKFWEIFHLFFYSVIVLLKSHMVDFFNQHTGLQIFNSFSTIKIISYPFFQGSISGTINPPNPTSCITIHLKGKSQKKYTIYLRELKEKKSSGSSSEAWDDNSSLQAPLLYCKKELSHSPGPRDNQLMPTSNIRNEDNLA